MDGNFITTIRTGAVGAIAAKYLAIKNSKGSETTANSMFESEGRVLKL
jgi:ornithine cyclodeaminase/alanine dehydrogenase-like protein (mu-crystallin family)